MFDPAEAASLLENFLKLYQAPYPLLEIPEYRVGQHGQWTLEKIDDALLIRGYFTAMQPATAGYRLSKGKDIWMSCTPMERESLAPHALNACGHSVVMGLGMGLLLYNILKCDEVDRVTVVERDRAVVELFHQIASPTTWTGWEKVSIVVADALTWKPDAPVDFLSVDIWSKLGDSNLRLEGQRIQQNVLAQKVALWGQELDFIDYAADKGYTAPATLSQYREYIKAIAIPLIEADNPDYPEYCTRAALTCCF